MKVSISFVNNCLCALGPLWDLINTPLVFLMLNTEYSPYFLFFCSVLAVKKDKRQVKFLRLGGFGIISEVRDNWFSECLLFFLYNGGMLNVFVLLWRI